MPYLRSLFRACVAVALVTVMLVGAVPASARTPLEDQLATHAEIERTIDHLRRGRERTVRRLRAEIESSTNRMRHMIGRGATSNPERFLEMRREQAQARREATKRIRRSARVVARRVDALQARRRSIDAWLATWGIFRYCPVRGWHSIADNFGITVRLPDVPVHRHTGSDIAAYSGTPIVAPFDGYASASSSELGGLEVRVTGSRGYVYNAHLSSYGALGYVRAGTVIGYVGATGDATTAHDHFEWHPYGGSAVDAYPYLRVSCG